MRPQPSLRYNIIEADTIQEPTTDLPVRFPSDTEVILEDVARFRSLTPREYSEEQKLLEQRNIREFLARHG